MSKPTAFLITAMGVSILALSLGLSFSPLNPVEARQGQGHHGDRPKDVIVANSPNEPIPTALQGISRIEGSVEIINDPCIKVCNPRAKPVLVRDVDGAALSPFRHSMFAQARNTEFSGFSGLYHVPAGKRLVIDYVSCYGTAYLDHLMTVTLRILNDSGGLVANIPIPLSGEGFFGEQRYAGSQLVKIILNEGEAISIQVDRLSRTSDDSGAFRKVGDANADVTLCGSLLDVPAP